MLTEFEEIQVFSNFPILDEHILEEEISILAPLLGDRVLELIKRPSRNDESRTVRKG